jgi:DNA-binding LacI/PurR family transcriptional regulator
MRRGRAVRKGVDKVTIAEAAGVSRTAVSLVLNHRPHTLSKATVKNILSTAKRLGYQGSRAPHIRCVGFIAESEDFFAPIDDFFQKAAAGCLSCLDGNDYNVMATFIESRRNRSARVPRVLREGGVDGFLLLLESVKVYEVVRPLVRALGVKAVFAQWILNRSDDAGWVASDDRAGCRTAAVRVARMGHRNVAILGALKTHHPIAEEHRAGFIEGLRAERVRVPAEWLLDGDWTRQSGHALMRRLLDSTRRRPTAVLCANDWIALGAMDAARERGLDIPREVSFVGVDNCTAAVAASQPRLSTVAVDTEEIGRVAAKTLVDWLESGEQSPPHAWVATEFVERGSLVPPAR